MTKYADQISAFEQKRAALVAANEAIMTKAAEDGSTLDTEQQESFDGNQADVKSIDDHLKRLREMEKSAGATAMPVEGGNERNGSLSRVPAQVKAQKPEAGIRLARFVRSSFIASKSYRSVGDVAEELYGQRDPAFAAFVKGNVVASNTTTDAALVGNEGGWADFVEYLRPRTIVGSFGTNGIPGLMSVPFRVPLITEASESGGYWVGEGKGIPLTKPTWGRAELSPTKVATIVAATEEQIRDSSPSAEILLRASITKALAKRLDQTFIGSASASGATPAGILQGISAIVSVGNDGDSVSIDVGAAMGSFATANNALDSGVWVMSANRALKLSLMKNALGQREYPEIHMKGGMFYGLPVIASNYIDTNTVALINAEDVYLGDEGGVTVDMSREASLQMVDGDSITQDSIGTADPIETSVVSMWQTDSVAFKAVRTINYLRRRVSAVAWISGVTWGEAEAAEGEEEA